MHRSNAPWLHRFVSPARDLHVRALFLAPACVLLAGCAGSSPPPPTPVDSPPIVNLANPDEAVPIEELIKVEYARIAPGDRIEVRVLSVANTNLSGAFLVLPDGKINFPLIGTLQASGYSVQEFDTQLSAALGVYYRNIDVSVNVIDRAERFVYVLGQVRTSGRYPMRAGDRVLHALSAAGGLTDEARENAVVLLRHMPDGTDTAYRLEFDRLHRVVPPRDVLVQPDDIVFVPKGRFQTFTGYMSEIISLLQSTAFTALALDDLANLRTRALAVQ
jgi:protein involved in polysaccharide export with SLBB domain